MACTCASCYRAIGEGALAIAANRSDSLHLHVLLQQNDLDRALQDNAGDTALHDAVSHDWADGVAKLITYHARVSTANARGETPLILAV